MHGGRADMSRRVENKDPLLPSWQHWCRGRAQSRTCPTTHCVTSLLARLSAQKHARHPLQMQQPQQSGAKPIFRTSQPGSAIQAGNRSNTLNANQIVKTRLRLRLSNNLQPGTRSKPSPTRGFPLNRTPDSTDSSRVFRTGIFISLGRSLGTGRPGRRR